MADSELLHPYRMSGEQMKKYRGNIWDYVDDQLDVYDYPSAIRAAEDHAYAVGRQPLKSALQQLVDALDSDVFSATRIRDAVERSRRALRDA